MQKQNAWFLLGGFAYGVLVGFGLFYVFSNRPQEVEAGVAAAAPSPAGPRAPSGQAPARGAAAEAAPMMAELGELKRRVQDNPEDVDALVRLANMYHQIGMWPEAASYYEKALAVREHPDIWTDLGTCYRQMGEVDRAAEAFEKAHRLDPNHWQSAFNLAVVAGLEQGRFERARQALADVERLKPDAPHLEDLKRALDHAEATGASGAEASDS